MRRYLAKLLAFLVLLGALFAAADAAVDAWGTERAEIVYAAFYDPRNDPEGILLGTSTAVFGLHPADLDAGGTRFYNFGYQGASAPYLAWWYDEYRRAGKRPKIVVHNLDWFALSAVPTRAFAHDSEYLPLPTVWRLAWAPGTDRGALVANRFALVKRRADLQAMLVRGRPLTGGIRELTDRMERGWLPLSSRAFYDRTPKPGADAVNPEQAAILEALYTRMRADGVRVVMVQTPLYLPLAGEHPAAQARLAAIARGAGVPFLNYNGPLRSALNQDRALFLDWAHLNERGSRRFGPILRRDLVARGLLPAP